MGRWAGRGADARGASLDSGSSAVHPARVQVHGAGGTEAPTRAHMHCVHRRPPRDGADDASKCGRRAGRAARGSPAARAAGRRSGLRILK